MLSHVFPKTAAVSYDSDNDNLGANRRCGSRAVNRHRFVLIGRTTPQAAGTGVPCEHRRTAPPLTADHRRRTGAVVDSPNRQRQTLCDSTPPARCVAL